MEGITLMEGKEFEHLKLQLQNIQQQNLAIIKLVQHLAPVQTQSDIPGFISIKDACEKYKTSHTYINNRIKLFKEVKGRAIDRLRAGSFKFINEAELIEGFRMKAPISKVINSLRAKMTVKK